MNQFEETYWKEIYLPYKIDGEFNAPKHIEYIHSFFKLHSYAIKTIIDIGFGNGKLLKEVIHQIKPKKLVALDISSLKTNELLKKKWLRKTNFAIYNTDFLLFDTKNLEKKPFDLSICNSVFQYIRTVKDLEECFIKLSKISKYVYLSIPTDKDYTLMKSKFDFTDRFAYQRTKEVYIHLIQKYFRIIGYNILESKKLPNTILNSELFIS
jgi:ubiquinone/menaquinone biosynthesis C-methylase UbiE